MNIISKLQSHIILLIYVISVFQIKYYNRNQQPRKMNMYKKILQQFNKQGLTQNSEITEFEVKKALDSIIAKNTGVYEFDSEVAHEIWNETQDQLVGEPVKLKDYIGTLIRAENILKQQVQHTQQLIREQTDQSKRQELLNDLFSYSQDHRTITMPFNLEQIRESKEIQQSRLNQDNLSIRSSVRSNLFSVDIDQRQESTDLKVVLFLTVLLLSIDIIIMFQKHHFFNLLGIFLIICAYVLNYFERKYVLFILGWFGVSIVLDIVWMVFNSDPFWNGRNETQHSNKQIRFLRFVVFFVAIEIIIKFFLIGLLFKYKDMKQTMRKKVKLGDLIFLLDGKPDINNLIIKAITGSKDAVSPFQV